MSAMRADATSAGPIRRVVIAGGGTAGWMAAAGLSRLLGRLVEIVLVESDEIGTVGVGEATIPSLQVFHQLLGIDERDFMAATQATFKLGIRFEHWRDAGRHYFHGFGLTGRDHWAAGFQHFWLAARALGLADEDYGRYCAEAQAARHGRFAHGGDDGLRYAYHLDATRYAAYLRRFSEALGVRRIEGRIAAVQADAATATLQALRLDSGAVVEGDLFVDCTGFRALLIGDVLQVAYEDWSHWLFNDRAVAVQTSAVQDPVPYTRSMAHGFGWQWCIPLQHRVGNGLVYSSRHVDDGEALATLRANLAGDVLTEPRTIRFRPGQRHAVWRGNCIAVGLSSGFIEPLESTSIYLIQRAVIRLAQMFPCHGIAAADVAEFNRQTREDVEHVRDFIVLHYAVTDRADTPYWRECRAMELPATLRHRLDLFAETARVFRSGNELFGENSWVQVMLGQGLLPRHHHRIAERMDADELRHFLDDARTAVERTVAPLPTHAAYLARLFGVAPPRPARA